MRKEEEEEVALRGEGGGKMMATESGGGGAGFGGEWMWFRVEGCSGGEGFSLGPQGEGGEGVWICGWGRWRLPADV